MKKIRISFKMLITLTLFIAPSISLGNAKVIANGGDVVVCKNSEGEVQSRELLDFHEARVLYDYKSTLKSSMTYEEALNQLLANMGFFDQYAQSVFRDLADSFMSEAKFRPNFKFDDVEDSHHIGLPKNCSIIQAAVQKTPEFPGDKRYFIDKDLWDLLDGPNQAGLVVHEILYRQHILGTTREEINSKSVRYFNGLIVSKRLDVFNFRQYLDFIKKEFGILTTNVDGYKTRDIEFYGETSEIKSFKVTFETERQFSLTKEAILNVNTDTVIVFHKDLNGNLIKISTEQAPLSHMVIKGHHLELEGNINFSLDSQKKVTLLETIEPYDQNRNLKIQNYTVVPANKIQHTNCHFISFTTDQYSVCSSHKPSTTFKNYEITIKDEERISSHKTNRGEYKVTFYPNGSTKQILCTSGRSHGFRLPNRRTMFCSVNPKRGSLAKIDFYKNGNVKSGGAQSHSNVKIGDKFSYDYNIEVMAVSPTKTCRSEEDIFQGYENDSPKAVVITYGDDLVNVRMKNGSTTNIRKFIDRIVLDMNGGIIRVDKDVCPIRHTNDEGL